MVRGEYACTGIMLADPEKISVNNRTLPNFCTPIVKALVPFESARIQVSITK